MNRKLGSLIIIVCLLLVAVWYFFNIFLYLIISLVLASLLRPSVSALLRLGFIGVRLPRFIAILFSFAMAGIFISLFVLLFVPLFSEQLEVISDMDFDSLLSKVLSPIAVTERLLISNELTTNPPGFLVEGFKSAIFDGMRELNFGNIINNLISFTGNFFIGLIAVLFMTFFLLYDPGIIRRPLFNLIPNMYFEVFTSAFFRVDHLLGNYLVGLFIQMIAIFTLSSVGLGLFGIKYALTIAVFAALANLVPYLGPILGTLFGVFVALSTAGSPGLTREAIFIGLEIVSVFGLVQVLDNVFFQPLIFSKSVKAHPLEIFVIIFAGATIAGIPGMIAAIPTYTILRVSVEEVYAGFNSYQVFRIK
ncbi:MAG: AI-2E family transporter [Cyclobacteriaceae bacterium]